MMFIQSRCMSTRIQRTNIRVARIVSVLFPLIATGCALSANDAPRQAKSRKMACKTPEVAASCYWAHGRLTFGNGNPTCRLWKIGTRRILGIYSGLGALRRNAENIEPPELPANVDGAFKTDLTRVYADFEICPLAPEQPGVMQAACIESAKNIVVE